MIYLFCVLAPSASFAFGGARSAPCLTQDEYGMGFMHVHSQTTVPLAHSHEDEHALRAGSVPSDSYQAGYVQSAHPDDHDDFAMAGAGSSSPVGDQHKSAGGGQCCGMMCVSALPATVMEFVRPSVARSLCAAVTYRNVADNAPRRLYRPPIPLS